MSEKKKEQTPEEAEMSARFAEVEKPVVFTVPPGHREVYIEDHRATLPERDFGPIVAHGGKVYSHTDEVGGVWRFRKA